MGYNEPRDYGQAVANSPVKLGQPSSALMSRFLTRGLFKGCPSFTRFSPALRRVNASLLKSCVESVLDHNVGVNSWG